MMFLHPLLLESSHRFSLLLWLPLLFVLHALLPFSLPWFSLFPLELLSGIPFFVLDSRLVCFLLRWFSSALGGSVPKFGSGGSPMDVPFGLTGVIKPISSSCSSCSLVRIIVLIALFILMSKPSVGMASLVST